MASARQYTITNSKYIIAISPAADKWHANNQTSDNDNDNDEIDITELLKFCYKTIHCIVWCDAQNAMYIV